MSKRGGLRPEDPEERGVGTAMISQRHPAWAQVPDQDWQDWRWQLKHRVTSLAKLDELFELSASERKGILARAGQFPIAITPYYLSLMRGKDCGLRRQAIPVEAELFGARGDLQDPLAEDAHSPVPGLSHRYPDRALLYVTHNCPVYCRHCTRQRKVGDAQSAPSRALLDAAIAYIAEHPEIFDVLISGGDPLSLSDDRLVEIIERLRAIPHVGPIRICTRNPVTLPFRISDALVQRLRPLAPIYVSTHFNHPHECSPEAAAALNRMADAGLNLGNQMVLLAGVNDRPELVEELNRWLVRQRCRPYYMFQCDAVAGTAHLRTPLRVGLEILDYLRGRLSGLAIPQFAVDLPGGGGKITLCPERLLRVEGVNYVFRDYRGREFHFVDTAEEGLAPSRTSHRLPVWSPRAASEAG